MKVLYIISSTNKNKVIVGGHYYSLKAIADSMAANHDVLTLAVMHKNSDAVDSYNHRVEYIYNAEKSFKAVVREVEAWLRKEKPDVVHSFDTRSHRVAKKACANTKTPLVETKPGGPSSRHTYPFAWDITMFTEDDINSYSKHPILRRANLHYIPNRVSRQQVNPTRLAEFPDLSGFFNLFTINSISEPKRSIIWQTLSMAKELRKKGVKARAVVIGKPFDEELKAELQKAAHPDDILLHELPYISRASEYLPLADAVVAMGRGAMEALGSGKPVFCPSSDHQHPYLLNDETFHLSIASNFTQRSKVSVPLNKRLDDARKVAVDTAFNEQVVGCSAKLFDGYCNIESAIPRYEAVYASARVPPRRPMERHLMYLASILFSR